MFKENLLSRITDHYHGGLHSAYQSRVKQQTYNTMTIERPVLTVEDGIFIQDEHLSEWKRVLKDDAYQTLEVLVKKYNKDAKTGYDVVRGTRIHEILLNAVIPKF
jgi:hypothetical protein